MDEAPWRVGSGDDEMYARDVFARANRFSKVDYRVSVSHATVVQEPHQGTRVDC